MMDITTVCSVNDAPAIRLKGVPPDSIITSARIKSLHKGQLTVCGLARTIPGYDDAYLALPDYEMGDLVAYRVETATYALVDEWLSSDDTLPYSSWLITQIQREGCPAKDSPESQVSDPEQDSEEPDSDEDYCDSTGAVKMSASDLRSAIIAVMKRQDRAMTTREIAAIINLDTVDGRNRVSATMCDMEEKGLVKRGGSVRSNGGGGRPASMWVIA